MPKKVAVIPLQDEVEDAVLAAFDVPKTQGQRYSGAKEFTVKLWQPHPKQKAFLDSKVKRKVVRAGRRGGKTIVSAEYACLRLLAGRRVLYCAPTADQVEAFWAACTLFLADAIDGGAYVVNIQKHTISVPGPGEQARIRAKTAWNVDTMRGDYADDLILDEWQLMDEQAWEIVGAPMVMQNNGDAVFIYTPPSLASKAVSKARDKRHASKLYKQAEEHAREARLRGVEPEWDVFHWTSYDNPHVSRAGLAMITKDMTSLSQRQEIMAEEVDQAPGALWKRVKIEELRIPEYKMPPLTRTFVGVDPPGGATECGIVVAGVGMCKCLGAYEEHGFVLADNSTKAGQGPDVWAPAVARSYTEHEANAVIVEINFGGDMVKHTIATEDRTIPVFEAHASKGKAVRAEPVAALYEKGKIHHVGTFPDLEDEYCQWTPGQTGNSPNRLDAAVWALSKLMVKIGYSPGSDGKAVTGAQRDPTMAPMVRPRVF